MALGVPLELYVFPYHYDIAQLTNTLLFILHDLMQALSYTIPSLISPKGRQSPTALDSYGALAYLHYSNIWNNSVILPEFWVPWLFIAWKKCLFQRGNMNKV